MVEEIKMPKDQVPKRPFPVPAFIGLLVLIIGMAVIGWILVVQR